MYVFDIDGTIADCTHRLHYIQNKPKNWFAFYAQVVNDRPIFEVIRVLEALANEDNDVVFVTGRSESTREATLWWIGEWVSYYHHSDKQIKLYMRKEGDHREDTIVKSELIDEVEKLGTPILGIFDDRQQVVDMYREKGYKVFQVAKGDF